MFIMCPSNGAVETLDLLLSRTGPGEKHTATTIGGKKHEPWMNKQSRGMHKLTVCFA